MRLLSAGVFIRWDFCPLGILSVGTFVRWDFCPLGLVSARILSVGLLSAGILSYTPCLYAIDLLHHLAPVQIIVYNCMA